MLVVESTRLKVVFLCFVIGVLIKIKLLTKIGPLLFWNWLKINQIVSIIYLFLYVSLNIQSYTIETMFLFNQYKSLKNLI